jgi:Flp pilus assembly protein TadB
MSDPDNQLTPRFNPQPDPPKVAERGDRPLRLRLPAIIFVVLGLIVLLAGIAKFLPGGVATGATFIFWGVLLFALSFIRLPLTTGAEEPPLSGIQKLAGIFYEPTRVFKNLRAHPHWLAAFLVVGILSAIYTAAFVQRLTPERIVSHTLDKLQESPFKPPPDQIERMRDTDLQQAKQPIQRVQTAAKSFVGLFVFACFVAGLCLLGVLAFGGRINFWQAFAAVLYSFVPVVVITKVISLVILYIKAPEDIHPILGAETLLQDNLGILFTPAEHPALFVLGSVIGVLSFYGLWLRAKGLANAGQKVSSGTAWGVSITLFVLATIVGMIFTTLFSSFIS